MQPSDRVTDRQSGKDRENKIVGPPSITKGLDPGVVGRLTESFFASGGYVYSYELYGRISSW